MSDEQQPKDRPRPWGRLFGVPKRWLGTIATAIALCVYHPQVYQVPGAMLREGVIKFGGDVVKEWLKDHTEIQKPSQIETGSIIRQELRKHLEAECVAQKARETATLTERRKAAAADHKKCLAEWVKPSWFSDQTAEQYCSPRKELYLGYARDLKEREAKDCTAPAPK